ncbi:ATP-dependent zinc metalloprotease FtsH [Ignatzschineria sp. RMDPL8A]|uniref:ATP-dependent zinc metalloprotease FtsH n=1 Tax=Ignatzschineria sp. RMDPL8A TaxID=2999236 RepID=UPI002A5E25DC|nr:ATP-dependent zinc metalloprotease FtsH [Ignatzschineria sp. RMDPL8A]
MKYTGRDIAIWLGIGMFILFLFQGFGSSGGREIRYSDFLDQVDRGQIKEVTITGSAIDGVTNDNRRFSTISPETDNGPMIDTLRQNKVSFDGRSMKTQGVLLSVFLNLLPILLLLGFFVFMMRQSSGGGKNPMSFGKSKARMLTQDQIKTTFADVAGADEAKQEVGEIVEFLRDPSRFQKLGGTMPRGILMVGSPGTGKTLLAKAIAGEARVPFFTISGSDFMEMFVGVGASRVRDMFEQAKKHAPCIIFIDEIDAVGRHRGAGLGGGHDEREQTLNQLLVEMDGFNENEGVIVIAATNRPDVLDPALLRPGRFDRQVVVPLPDVKGRVQILNVHMKKIKASSDINVEHIARGTPGFSGADLANLVNEAALFAARRDQKEVYMKDMEDAKDKIMMGAERNSMVMTEDDKRLTAYHEAGHAIVGYRLKSDPVYKVTIIPRGRALGVTMTLPERDHVSVPRRWLENKLAMVFGGRIAEEIIFGYDAVTTGAASDIQHATSLAKSMVTKWGLSDKLGFRTYSDDNDEPFLGRSMGGGANGVSDQTARLVDEEIRAVIDRNYERAEQVLNDDIDKLHKMAEVLLELETIDADQVKEIMEGKPVTGYSKDNEGSDDDLSDSDVAEEKEFRAPPKLDPIS